MARTRRRRRSKPQWYLWDKAKTRAKKHGLEFSIKVEDVVIPTHCPVLGIPLVILSKDRWYDSATIDRIDTTKGYTLENICVISARANSLKGDGTLEELSKVVKYMEKHL